MSRTTQPTAMRVTGIGELTHGIRIGKFQGGYFSHKRGEGGKKYSRSLSWSSFEDFMAALKGEAARDVELALYFKDNPPPKWLIGRLEEPLEIPYKAETPAFDGWTKLKPHQADQARSEPRHPCKVAGVRHGRRRGLRNGLNDIGGVDSGWDCHRPVPIHSGDGLAFPPDQPAPFSDW